MEALPSTVDGHHRATHRTTRIDLWYPGRMYVSGRVDIFDMVDIDLFTAVALNMMVLKLDEGLYALACEEDVRCLATLVKSFKLIEVYIEHGVTVLDSYLRAPRFRATLEDITDEPAATASQVIDDVMRQLSFDETELDGEAGFVDVTGSGVDSSGLSHDESFGVDDLDLNLNEPVNLNVSLNKPDVGPTQEPILAEVSTQEPIVVEVSTQEPIVAEVNTEALIVEEVGTQEFNVEDVVIKDYVSSRENREDRCYSWEGDGLVDVALWLSALALRYWGFGCFLGWRVARGGLLLPINLNVSQVKTQSELPVSEEPDVGPTQEPILSEVSTEAPIVEEVGTQEFSVEDVVIEDYVSFGEYGEDPEQGIDTAYETEYDVQSSEDVGTYDDDDVVEDFLVDEENEIVEPDVDVHLFGISMDLPFDNIGITYLVPDDVLEGEDVDVVNVDGFDSDTSNDEERNYRKRRLAELRTEMKGVINASGHWKYSFYTGQQFTTPKEAKDRVYLHSIKSRRNLKLYKNDSVRIRARCEGKVPVFTMS
ncbi:putative transposase, mutator type, MULE transposase domain protein [Tanacetum coccineum]